MKKFVVICIVILFIGAIEVNAFHISEEMNQYQGQELQSSVGDSGSMDYPWPMFQYDAKHTGRSPYGVNGTPGVLKWKFKMNGMSFSSPAINKDGIIYIGSTRAHCLYAICPDGTEKWRCDIGEWIHSSPAIATDGIVYVGSDDGKLYAIYPNGTKKWELYIGHSWVYSSPVIDNDGIIYVASVGGNVGNICAVYQNGTKKWDITLGGMVYCTPGLDNDGIVYCGANDGCMYAIYTSNGTIKWKYKTGEKIGSAPTIDDDGTIYFGSNDGYLYALFPNGTLKWRFLTREFFGLVSSPAIAEDGSIIVGSGLGYVYSINPDDGTENWRFGAGADVSASPAIDKYGIIYVGAWNGMFYALNPDGTLRWKFKTLDYILSSAAIGEDGTIYVGAFLTSEPDFYVYLYAIKVLGNQAPEKPSIDGPLNGKILTRYTYTASTSDPDGDKVSYLFDWGDGTPSVWTRFVASGKSISHSHTWLKEGTYTVKVKAKDIYGAESRWATLQVTMPRNRIINNPLFVFLENHPNLFPIIRLLLRL